MYYLSNDDFVKDTLGHDTNVAVFLQFDAYLIIVHYDLTAAHKISFICVQIYFSFCFLYKRFETLLEYFVTF